LNNCVKVGFIFFIYSYNIDGNILEKIPKELVKKVTSNLSIDLPLQITVPYVDDEDYWKKCCQMRWNDGKLAEFLFTEQPDQINDGTKNDK